MIFYKIVLSIPLILLYATLYLSSSTYRLREKTRNKKILFSSFFIGVYLFLIYLPAFISARVFGIILFIELVLFFNLSFGLEKLENFNFRNVLIAMFLILLILPSSILGLFVYANTVENSEIRNSVGRIIPKGSSTRCKVDILLNWQKQNMKVDSGFILDLPFYFFRVQKPSYIFYYRRGRCGEYAILFEEMAEISGLKVREVHNPGEDHAWTEVWIENDWKHVDPSNNYFNQPTVYEENWHKQISYVYALYDNGNWKDVTDTYTQTGELIVHVTKNEKDVENAEIKIKSRYLMENVKGYNSPRNIVDKSKYLKNNRTNENGICVFHLGKNRYNLIATKEGKRTEKIISLTENRKNRENLSIIDFEDPRRRRCLREKVQKSLTRRGRGHEREGQRDCGWPPKGKVRIGQSRL